MKGESGREQQREEGVGIKRPFGPVGAEPEEVARAEREWSYDVFKKTESGDRLPASAKRPHPWVDQGQSGASQLRGPVFRVEDAQWSPV